MRLIINTNETFEFVFLYTSLTIYLFVVELLKNIDIFSFPLQQTKFQLIYLFILQLWKILVDISRTLKTTVIFLEIFCQY